MLQVSNLRGIPETRRISMRNIKDVLRLKYVGKLSHERIGLAPSPSPTNATKKPIDSSAHKSLIYIGVTGVPSGLRPALAGPGRRENVQTESKTCRLLAEMVLSEVRKNPQEPA